MPFQDHFSALAAGYARARPGYPPALFEYLAEVAPGLDLAWDCGTGNGQAALGLARHFRRVHATDASAEQLRHAEPHERVSYRREPAEAVSLGDASADLAASAVAVHWFDFDAFYAEVRRVLKPGGVIAVWTYHLPRVSEGVDRAVAFYHGPLLAGYWPERVRYLNELYRTIPFPFDELQPPPFEMTASWTLEQLAAFLASWSGAARYQQAMGRHPLEEIWPDLSSSWGPDTGPRTVTWDLHMRIGVRR
jgi:SAM-dependent methyltransferase